MAFGSIVQLVATPYEAFCDTEQKSMLDESASPTCLSRGFERRMFREKTARDELMSKRRLFFICVLLCTASTVFAADFKVSSGALERTLRARLFNTADQRYYVRGDAQSPCRVYVEDPHLSFSGDRILVRVHTAGRLGTQLGGRCLGVPISMNTVISLAPSVEGETIGVTDARMDRLSDSAELNFILTPFLSRKLPSSIKINAATMLREILTKSTETSGYPLTLERLDLRQVKVTDRFLVVTYDSDMRID
jgi:hypothetical protein